MTKIALVTDTHFGARSDSIPFDNFFRRFYEEIFFPEIDKRGIKHVIHLGDCFDRRKYINFNTLSSCRNYFFDEIKKRDIELHMIVGNHDTFFKNTNDVNSPRLLLKDYEFNVIDSPSELEFDDGSKIFMMPWICTDNYNQSMEAIKTTDAQVLFGHFEIAGFQMYKGHENDEGFDPKIFEKFDLVCSGHFHHRSSNGNINYLGNPYELTWADFEDPRGFHIFDSSERSLDFIQNPFSIFSKVYYDDEKVDPSTVDVSQYANQHIKLIVVNKKDYYKYDQFIERLYKVNPLELKIIEDLSEFESDALGDEEIDLEDTVTLLSQYVDSLETEADKDRIKTLMKTLYVEAQNWEDTV
jgi:DNA repair exonuclease SbcCD nuclease subunit